MDLEDYELKYDNLFTITFRILNNTKYKTVKSIEVFDIEDHFPSEKPVEIAYQRDLVFKKHPLTTPPPKFVDTFNTSVISSAFVALGVSTSAVNFVLTGAGNGGIMSLVKLFQILDILSNLSKVNVNHGEGIQSIFDFIDSISLPKIPFAEKLSPILTNDYIYHSRHTRKQLIKQNIDTFIFADSIFILAILILLLKGTSKLLEKKNILKNFNKIFAWAYFLIFNVAYYDLQIIVFTELTQSKIISKKDGKVSIQITLSYVASFLIGLLMVTEIWKINFIFKGKRDQFKRVNQNLELKALILERPKDFRVVQKVQEYLKEGLSYSDSLLVTKFTEDISPYSILIFKGCQFSFQIINFSRILVMMLLIASMQLIAVGQIVIILVVQFAFMVYMFQTIFKRECIKEQLESLDSKKGSERKSQSPSSQDGENKNKFRESVMKGKVVKCKFIVLEMCTVMMILTMLVFSLNERTQFRDTIYYARLEKTVMWLLILAIFSELFFFSFQIYQGAVTSYKQRKIAQLKIKNISKKTPQYLKFTQKQRNLQLQSSILISTKRGLLPDNRSLGESSNFPRPRAIRKLRNIATHGNKKLGENPSTKVIRKAANSQKKKSFRIKYYNQKNNLQSVERSTLSGSKDRANSRPTTKLRLTRTPEASSLVKSCFFKQTKLRGKMRRNQLQLKYDSLRSIQTSKTVKKPQRIHISKTLNQLTTKSPNSSSRSRFGRRINLNSRFKSPEGSKISDNSKKISSTYQSSPISISDVGSIIFASPSRFKKAVRQQQKRFKFKKTDDFSENDPLSDCSQLSQYSDEN